MNSNARVFFLSFFISILFPVQARVYNAVAQVSFLKGRATLLDQKTGQSTFLLKGDWLPEGSIVKTPKKALIKLRFKDGSTVVLGPEGRLRIESFKTQKAGVLNLVKGQIRSAVKKSKSQKIKLIIKTPKAAMGVRGTDFQILVDKRLTSQLLVSNGLVTALTNVDELIPLEEQLEKVGINVGPSQYHSLGSNLIVHFNDPLKMREIIFDESAPVLRLKAPNLELSPIEKLVADCQKNAREATEDALKNGQELGRFFHESH